ncbi:MAG TPA: sigma 54-interacting transcriptional regulator [Polyangiaceae bacterium]|nr:sigma 54-interacting transcriptional regulator [Polyangiaceae bacterium]
MDQVAQVVIGRGSERASQRTNQAEGTRVHVSVPARTMSSMHARLVNHRGHWSIQDLNSTNGTFVNGIRVQEAILGDRDVIEVGRVWFVFRQGLPTPSSCPVDADGSSVPGEMQVRTLVPHEAEQLRILNAIARTKLPVLLLGESGTGKELLARQIHAWSERSGALVPINSAALASSLLESQLFGYNRGAFSGAVRDEPGLVRAADRGTLFLDEIGDMPAAAQVALLRVLQEGDVLAVGGTRPIPVDVRVIAATHRPLHSLAASGEFRADLLGRLRGHLHTLPALRQRREDLGLLLAGLLSRVDPGSRIQRITADAARSLLSHDYPLNVRELEHALTRAAALAEDGTLHASHLDSAWVDLQGAAAPVVESERPPLSPEDELLRSSLLKQLSVHRGNIADVARAMGKARMQIHRWLKRFEIDPASYRKGRAP